MKTIFVKGTFLMLGALTTGAIGLRCFTDEKACEPNSIYVCNCPGGESGRKVCNSSGTGFSECDCNGSNTDGGDEQDGGVDGSAEQGTDGSQNDLWPWCPKASSYVGGSWSWSLLMTSGALYCSTTHFTRSSLEQELAWKARVRFVPGSYPVPTESGVYAFLLPLCFEMVTPDTEPLLDAIGTITANISDKDGGKDVAYTIRQQVKTKTGTLWYLIVKVVYWLESGQNSIPINGDDLPGLNPGPLKVNISLCKSSDCNESLAEEYYFLNCNFNQADWDEQHTVQFEGGNLQLNIRRQDNFVTPYPSLFYHAKGELDGSLFEQSDYFHLIYHPGDNVDQVRNFAVLFDHNISGACGIKVVNLEPNQDEVPTQLSLVGCDLSEIAGRPISNESFQ